MRSPLAPLLFSVVLWILATAACGEAGCGQIGPLTDGGVDVPEDSGTTLPVSGRCEVPLDAWVHAAGSGAYARQLLSPADGIGGPNAHGKAGDFLLGNDRIRVVIQGEDRHIGANPWGGTILDADLVRDGPGQDQFGELGLLYNFGRTVRPTVFEVLSDGTEGGSAIVAATGYDADNDYLSIRNQLRNQLGTVPAADPYVPVPLKITNYFILNPGEQRVRFVTAFCNEGTEDVHLAVGDLTDPGYTVEFFNGQSCTGGFGFGGVCFGLDRMSWYGYQGDDVAYGYAPWKPNAPSWPESQNAIITVSGITGSINGAAGLQGLLQWFTPDAGQRGGEVRLRPGQSRAVLRDFVVGRDLGEVASLIYAARAEASGGDLGTIAGEVTSGGAPVARARVAVRDGEQILAMYVTDAQGRFEGRLPAGSYQLSGWAEGRAPSPMKDVAITNGGRSSTSLSLGERRQLTVRVRDGVTGEALPAKVTVVCSGVCPAPASMLNEYTDAVRDPLLDGIQHVGLVPVNGEATFALPPGQYNVLVSRGPEYSIHPNTYPNTPGVPVDLHTADGTVEARLVRVLDTTGFMSADFHVHAVNSPDSAVDNQTRALSFAAEGVDVLVSTDHDYVTDFAPYVQAIGAQNLLATVVGEEVSTMDFGHYNLFPLEHDETDRITGGAVDWAGGEGPTLTVAQIFEQARSRGARTIHVNHARGFLGGFTHLRLDTDTLATHADPADFRMATPPGGTPADTRIFSSSFDALEILNAGEDGFQWSAMYPKFNDWFTLLSRGMRITGTGVSDTHYRNALSGGYWRTWVQNGQDTPVGFSPAALSDALNSQKAVASNGPFVRIRAVRVNGAGEETTLPAGMGEVLAPSAPSDGIKVTLDIQVPEYLDVTRVELYTHSPADDARCPIDPSSPQAKTTRVACDGKDNRNWPLSSIAASKDLTLTAANAEVVANVGGVSYRRWRVQTQLQLPPPTTDNWIVAFVYGSKPLFPLVYDKQSAGSAMKPILPFALTNPIYVDADGAGFDKPPFDVSTPPKPPLAWGPLAPRQTPVTAEELLQAWEPLSGVH